MEIMHTIPSVEESQKEKEEATKIRKYRPFAFPTRPGTGRFHVAPYDCCKLGELDICCDTVFCPCCLWAKLQSNIDFAKNNSRLYEETSSDDDDQNAVGVVKSELSRYERRFSSDRSYCDCGTCVQAGFAFLPLSAISTVCLLNGLADHFDAIFGVKGNATEEKKSPLYCCSICCGGDHADAGGQKCDNVVLLACGYTFLGTTCTSLLGSFYARELRHRQLYDGGCISAATPQVPSRGWLRRRKVQLVKEHGQTRMKLALDIYRVAWIVSRFLPKLKNRYQFFDENLKIPQMV